MRNLIAVLVLMLAMAVVAPVGAAELRMDTVVSKVEGGHVEFTDKTGNFYFFTDITDPLRVGDKAELIVDAIFDGENFKVRDMEYNILPIKFPNTMEELVAMYAGMAAICLAVFFGGFIAGHLHSKPRKNRRVYVHS